jgi:hypothetical protein
MVNIAVRAFAQGVTVASVGPLSLATALPAQQHY